MAIVLENEEVAGIETPSTGWVRLFYENDTKQLCLKDDTGTIHCFFTGELETLQDLLGTSFVDTSSINFTYDDGANRWIADVLTGGVDHNALLNYEANKHIDWTAAGAGTLHTDNYEENKTHTGEVTGALALTVNPVAVSNKSVKSTLTGLEEVLINDDGVLKKTTVQILTEAGSGSHSLNCSWSEIKVKDTSYAVGSRYIFQGTSKLGIPINVKIIASVKDGAGIGSCRIYDSTNNKIIAENSGITNEDPSILDLGTISNLPTDEAIFEIQLKTSDKKKYCYLYGLDMVF